MKTAKYSISVIGDKTLITTFSVNEVFANWSWNKRDAYEAIETNITSTLFDNIQQAQIFLDTLQLPSEGITDDGTFGGSPNDHYKELVKYELEIDNSEAEACTPYELPEDVEYNLLSNNVAV